VKNWLVRSLQLVQKFIVVRAFGKAEPIVKEGDREAQAANRRVDIKMRKTTPTDGVVVGMLGKPGEIPRGIPVDDDEGESIPKAIPVPDDEGESIPKAITVPDDEKEAIPKAITVPDDEKEAIPKAIPVPDDEKEAIPKAIMVPDDEKEAILKAFPVSDDELIPRGIPVGE
jgi:DNA-directed RNA polymerase subunit H (RpoH/RPB5)